MCCTWQVECKEHHHILAHKHQLFCHDWLNMTQFVRISTYNLSTGHICHLLWPFTGCYLRYLAPTWLLGKLVALNRATSTLLE